MFPQPLTPNFDIIISIPGVSYFSQFSNRLEESAYTPMILDIFFFFAFYHFGKYKSALRAISYKLLWLVYGSPCCGYPDSLSTQGGFNVSLIVYHFNFSGHIIHILEEGFIRLVVTVVAFTDRSLCHVSHHMTSCTLMFEILTNSNMQLK